MDSRRICLALLALMVAATIAIIMAAESAEAGFLLTNVCVCKRKTTEAACQDCCASKGYNREDSQFDGDCSCHLTGVGTKLRKSDILYRVSEDENTLHIIERAEAGCSCWPF